MPINFPHGSRGEGPEAVAGGEHPPAGRAHETHEPAVESVVRALARDAGAEDAHALIRRRIEARPAQSNPVLVPRTAQIEARSEAGPPPPRQGVLREVRRLLKGVRRSPHGRPLFLLAAGLVMVIIGNMVGQIYLNTWHGAFFDALENKQLAAFGYQLVVFVEIVAALLALVVAQTWLQEMMKVRLRAWITHRLLDSWLVPGRAYRLGMASELGTNPDQRIQEDSRQVTELSTELGVGLLQSSLLLISFMGILWALSSQVVFEIAGRSVAIPGYMVWCAIAYALLGSFLTWRVGFPLIDLNSQRYAREAEFRFALVRVSESAESVALYGGEADERRILDGAAGTVLAAMRRLSGALSRLTWITSGYGWLMIVIPILVAAPGYFSGGLTLGGLMMVVGAFNQVSSSLRWFVDNFPRIADWRASLGRVASFQDALDHVDTVENESQCIRLADHPRGGLAFEDVGILLHDGHVVIEEANAEIRPGERVLIVGESGSGKSTLFRAIAGLWPWGHGLILLPPRNTMQFMPQRPYLPLGTLRSAVTYPAGPDEFSTEAVTGVLERVGLGRFVAMLDHEERWDKSMSLGQQQRLAFARLLLHRPLWVFLDEATSALDEDSQQVVMSIFDRELPDAAVISIGHRPGLEDFHSRTLQLVPSPSGARLRRKAAHLYGHTTDRLLTRLFRSRWLGRGLPRRTGPPL